MSFLIGVWGRSGFWHGRTLVTHLPAPALIEGLSLDIESAIRYAGSIPAPPTISISVSVDQPVDVPMFRP